MRLLLATLLAFFCALTVQAVKREDFKECHQTSFCRRLRGIAGKQAESTDFASPYSVDTPVHTPGADGLSWTFPLHSSLYPEIQFELRVDLLENDIARVRADEINSASGRQRYNETSKWAFTGEPSLASPGSADFQVKGNVASLKYGPKKELELEIVQKPLQITMKRDGKPQVVFNERSLFHVEHYRAQQVDEPASEEVKQEEGEAQKVFEKKGDGIDRSWFETEDADMFRESWRKWTDSKPKGPEGLSLDFTFPGVEHVFGLPEHASPLSLPSTVGENSYYKEPYRLWNVDIFEYEADSPMALYGAVPLIHAHTKESTVGVLNLVASETWVDVAHDKDAVRTHWVSESGIVDFLILPGPKPIDLFEQYASLTGNAQMPPHWATAYHQCRWNYNTQDEVIEVQDEFDEADIPLDVTWLDIEYANGKRYFDWDKGVFPDPVAMLDEVESRGRKMVAIIDPHIKREDSFRIYSDAKDLDILIKKADGSNFDGWCWPGSSVWVDFFNPKSWEWWTRMFDFKTWVDSTRALFIWNDMNEPSVFDGPEITMPKDNIHEGGWEHRDIHNINGMLFHNQTQAALTVREEVPKRPFVLSRSFFAGSQRYGAIWIGDNLGTWAHLAGEAAVFLSNTVAGISFVGSDVGGFFGNPNTELLVRWYQAGAFMPFFRAHAHIDTKRREPYLFAEPYKSIMRNALRLRYQLLPVWYNAFRDAASKGWPVIWPQYAYHPSDAQGFAIDDQYYVGRSGLLFKPVVTEGAEKTEVYLADNEPYYDYFSHQKYPASSKPRNVTVETPLDKFPLLIQGGHIFPSRERVRRSSPLAWQDPYTLTVAVGRDGTAKGELYSDDGVTFGFQKGEFIDRLFSYAKDGTLSSRKNSDYDDNNAWAKKIAHVRVERVVILGASKKPKAVTVGKESVAFEYDRGDKEHAPTIVIKNPPVTVAKDWDIVIT